jgi:hypothetical protein
MSATPDQPELTPSVNDEQPNEREENVRRRAKRARARRVLVGVLIFLTAGLGLYAIWPWLLPAFIWEGPLLQKAGPDEVTLIWYMTRPVGDGLHVTIGDGARQASAVETDGRRCRAVLTGLQPGQTYPYTIKLGRRTLAQHKLRTNKRADEPFTFIVFGDSGKGTQEQYLLATRMIATQPDFILHTGDLIYSRGERRHYRSRFFVPYGELLAQVSFWPSIGNHDVFEPIDASPYFDVFELPENGPPELPPEHNYWFDYAAARIAVIDTELDEATLADQVAPWLYQVLAEADTLWRFVVFHRPPYTAGAHAPSEEVQRAIVPVLESTGVDVVFNGHDHMYERTHPIRDGELAEDGDGVVYVVSGAGGAMLYEALPPEQRPPYLAALHNEVHSFTHVSVAGSELTLEQISLDGEILDRWTLRKTADAAPAP